MDSPWFATKNQDYFSIDCGYPFGLEIDSGPDDICAQIPR